MYVHELSPNHGQSGPEISGRICIGMDLIIIKMFGDESGEFLNRLSPSKRRRFCLTISFRCCHERPKSPISALTNGV